MDQDDFRIYAPEIVPGPDGQPVFMQLCEERDPESGRWEPFYTVVKIASR